MPQPIGVRRRAVRTVPADESGRCATPLRCSRTGGRKRTRCAQTAFPADPRFAALLGGLHARPSAHRSPLGTGGVDCCGTWACSKSKRLARSAWLLTKLTTRNGSLPQGGIPSSYLANLVFWRDESLLHAKLRARGIRYSRYVDDIAMSSTTRLARVEKSKAIADVYGMLEKHGLTARRDKHEIMPANK